MVRLNVSFLYNEVSRPSGGHDGRMNETSGDTFTHTSHVMPNTRVEHTPSIHALHEQCALGECAPANAGNQTLKESMYVYEAQEKGALC